MNWIQKVCIIGGGNMGTALIADLVRLHPDLSISLLTSKPEEFQNVIQIEDSDRKTLFFSHIPTVTSDPQVAVTDADIIFITHPSFMVERTFCMIRPYVKSGAYVGIIPGLGGCEFYWKKYFNSTMTLFGYQRVPYIVRIKKYGASASVTSRREKLILGSIPASKTQEVCEIISWLCVVPCVAVPNYLAITLTPSNPILHTARIYDLFMDAEPSRIFPENIKFYAAWTLRASHILLRMNSELQHLCNSISGLDLRDIVSLDVYYESHNVVELTNKMCSITSLRNIDSPMLRSVGGYVPDLKSRYFVEDFPFGLCIIKGFCEIYHIETPLIDEVLMWYEKFAGVEYFVNGKFVGKDLVDTAIPQNFGITTPEMVSAFYGGRGVCAPTHQ